MSEKNLDFDTVIDRKNTNCLKYDFAVERGKPEKILPLWVADMDFRISSYIQEALFCQAEHGIYGYSDTKETYFDAVSSWMSQRHHWKVEKEWLIKTPGIVFALAMAVKAFTEKGDAVLISQPVYYPFSEVIKDNERRVADSTLFLGEDGRYHYNFQDFEDQIIREKVKLFFLCNPHNPVGRVWTREELLTIGEICRKHKVIVVSDEIHSDLVFRGEHQVFVNLKEEFREFTITCTSPSKTFNIAGLQVSNIFIPNEETRKKFQKQIDAAGYSQLNAAGLAACEAAYRYGGEWYEAMMSYVRDNIAYMKSYIDEKIPEIKMTEPEGTYLVWIDFRSLLLSNQELEDLIINKAGLWLDSGAIFGPSGEGFQRVNAACARATLTEALERLKMAVESVL
ncbi:MAG: MalY/PatB family protein [Fusicatenibacter sp.]